MASTTTILITVDSLRYDYLFGDRREVELPTIDRLADEGLHFDQAYTNAPYTADSFTSILGGTHPWRYGEESEGFEPDRPHVVEPFTEAGYNTLGVYANPFLGPSFGYDRGYTRYIEGDIGEATLLGRVREFVVENVSPDSRLFQTIRWSQRKVATALGTELEGRPYPDASEVNEAFIDCLAEVESPTFAWLHYMDVHTPLYPHQGTRSEGINESEAVRTFYETNMRPHDVSKEEKDLLQRLYVGEIQYLDRKLDELLNLLDDKIGLEDTTVIFTSDHGEGFGEHGFCFHPKELYQELVRIPLLVWTPEVEATTIDVPVSNIDIVPTLLQSAEIDVPDAVEGCPLQEVAQDPPDQRYVFAQAIDNENRKVMACDGSYKLIRHLEAEREELFNLRDDPGERENIVGQNPDTRRLRNQLDEHLAEMDDKRKSGSPADREIPESVEQQLKDLGYN
jgi:arylsulfatase A-like enzyme